MNLFSRLSEILEERNDLEAGVPRRALRRARRLMAWMERQQLRFRQSAAVLFAAARETTRELDRRRQDPVSDPVLLIRLQEEQQQAHRIYTRARAALQRMGAGLRHARSLHDSLERWSQAAALRNLAGGEHAFWSAYHELADLADERLDCLECMDTRAAVTDAPLATSAAAQETGRPGEKAAQTG